MQRLNVGQARYAIIAPAVAMVAALGSTAALGQAQIAQPGARDTRPLVLPKPAIVAPSERLGLALVGVPTVHLRPVDVDALLAEDAAEAQFGSKALRVSIARDVLLLLRDGQWHDVDGGSLWVAYILAEDAIGLRLHFTGMDLPQGAEVVVTGSDKGLPMQGPFTKQGLLGDGAFWSGSTLGERVRIEYFVPDGAAGGNPDVPFAVDSLQHVYVDIYRGGGEEAGDCHNVPACFAAWDPVGEPGVADSVGRIFIAENGTVCSGQLINAVNSDFTPYFLTARHCGDPPGGPFDGWTASEAASAEVLWKFEQRTCAGGVVAGVLSNVCSLVSTYVTTDETLLMVEGTLPTGLFWSGWQASPVINGAASTCIHHPGTDFKRISFGTRIGFFRCSEEIFNYARLFWGAGDGVTEPGSSGGGIWRDFNQLLYGTLTCGGSSCDTPNLPDGFGRFDLSYNDGGFDIPLAAGSDDAFENNDSCATAALLPIGTSPNLVVKSTDVDWYVATLAPLGRITVDLTFTHSFGDIDMELLDACDGAVVSSALSNTNDETLSYTNSGPTITLFLRIFLADDTRNDYTMTVSIVLPCPEDINGDGNINVIDLIDVLLCFGQSAVPGCEDEDVNDDGSVNVLDLIDVLLLFGTSCP